MEREEEQTLQQKYRSWIARVRLFFHKIIFRSSPKEYQEIPETEAAKENPYLPKLRQIMEQLLPMYQMSYREFRPLLIDTDTPPESLLDDDPADVVLEQLSEDLNFLRIATERSAYFTDYIHRMYEDSGLVVQTESKGKEILEDINVILDLEKESEIPRCYMREGTLYIPVFKVPWKRLETLQNLDISIPIGYNTVIVKGIR